MCGIIGFSGELQAANVLVSGLEQLEYRGYDSAGIAVQSDCGVKTAKAVGNVSVLKEKIKEEIFEGSCGIGHTRWATHGGVSEANAHPHCFGKVTLIHNGIIENYKEIWEEYGEGKTLVSQTDTEIAAVLLDALYNGNPEETIRRAVEILEGSYAFCMMFEGIPETVYCIRKVSPLVAARAKEGSFVASDVTALIAYTQDYFVLPEDTILVLKKDELYLEDLQGKRVEPELLHVNWDTTAAQKNGYPHYMIKEIHEQPEALHNTIAPRMKEGIPDFEVDGIPDSIFENINQVKIVGCGTAMHAGLVGKAMMEKRVRIPVTVEIASEFRYQNPIIDDKTLVIVISQSGETIDTLASLRLAKSEGACTLGIVNVKGSTIARESDYVLYTHAGPEIAVASTKAYTVQIAALVMLAMRMAYVRGKLDEAGMKQEYELLKKSVEAVNASLTLEETIRELAHALVEKEDLF
ncbi:MAG: glutamine--fructose-6-phosphate transaminase (isomerizing), partial [Lachnospiraceae bacterium]|nr:glutamine--fructose-6-phosphate transaminase (isomerizing) [Lachnospiraceae bacterium]